MSRTASRALVWALVAYIVAAGTSEASASPGDEGEGAPAAGVDRADVVFPDSSAAPKCCVPPRDYGSRTTFVPEMLRSAEDL
jgi:hypothetical protein